MKQILDYIGTTGPYLLNILSFILLFHKPIYLGFYIIGYLLNIGLNLFLKNIIKDPRPNEDKVLFELALNHGKRFSKDKYGMPSGHVQGVAFSTIFIYLITNNIYILWLYLIITLLTMIQRYNYRNHTFFQIIVGLIIGLFFGYLYYLFISLIKKRNMRFKKDDNCFIK